MKHFGAFWSILKLLGNFKAFWKGGVKKTSPMKGKVFFTGDIHTYIQTEEHRDSMTELAQWADSVKSKHKTTDENITKQNIAK